jgi:hypothetical protein
MLESRFNKTTHHPKWGKSAPGFPSPWRRRRREEEEEEFITSGNWRGKHNSLSRGAGADQP